MNSIIAHNLTSIQTLFKKYKIVKAYLFGSIITHRFNQESDIDILIELDENLPPLELGENYWNLNEELTQLLKRKIDLIIKRSLKNKYFMDEINKSNILIYG